MASAEQLDQDTSAGASAKGLRVLVTAAGAGIGRAIAETFLNHGAKVHICDIDRTALAESRERLPAVSLTVADVANLDDVDRLFADVQEHLGGLDVLVNNAGIAGPTSLVEEIKPEDWVRCIEVDLNAMFYCTRLAMPLIKAAGGGSIINLSSVGGRLGYPMRTPYAAAKWAVVGFTKSLAIEAGPDHVRVNCIQPGVVEGPRVDRVVEAKARTYGITNEAMRDRLLNSVSLRTFVSAQDIANMALFLATDAGRHISGQALSVCGDLQYLP
jgi:NAD(P)-dependent dehydrogenase (short-subunit alcohol dehydrogenase family)